MQTKTIFVNLRKIKKSSWLLLTILIIGAFLRLYDFSDLTRFNADQVRDAKIVNAMTENEEFPLLGPKAGGTEFKLGPAFYYLEYISGSIFGFSPWGIAFLIPLFSVASIGLFYLLFKKLFSLPVTLFLTFLYASSFYLIKYSRFAWNPNFIPFFILAFILLLITIINKKDRKFTCLYLGLITGIGIQLHTTLLILMPVTLAAVLIFMLIKKFPLSFKKLALSFLIIIVLNIPFIYSDYLTGGNNFQKFFAGSVSKTTATTSVIKNLVLSGQFFVQGSAYTLSGSEPEKNWTKIAKLIQSRNWSEYILFAIFVPFFIWSILLFIRKLKSVPSSSQKNNFIFLAFFIGNSFILFSLIGSELNIRFFIVLIFLPYLLLGLIFEYLQKKTSQKIFTLLISCVAIILFISNIFHIYRAYDLNNYTSRESAYGGISLGEINSICAIINTELSQKVNSAGKTAYVDSFEFERSIEYVCQKSYNLKLEKLSKTITPQNPLIFKLVNKGKNIEQELLDVNKFSFLSSWEIGRFKLLSFQQN